MERLKQSEIFYPCRREDDSSITSLQFAILRLTDGLWLDFNDSAFKNTGWTIKWQSMTEDDDGIWLYSTGWATPAADAVYKIFYKDSDGYIKEGEKIIVGGYVDDIATKTQIADEVLTRPISNVEGSTVFRSLAGAIAKLVNRVKVAAGVLTVYKTDDTSTMGTQNVTTDANAEPITEADTV